MQEKAGELERPAQLSPLSCAALEIGKTFE
jgi:hypothetical protein